MKITKHNYSIKQQQGVIIVVALVTLLVMTLVGVTSMGNATLQERMAANNRLYFQARLNAEAALREAEDYLSGRTTDLIDINTGADIDTLFSINDVNHDHLYLNKIAKKTASSLATEQVSFKTDLTAKNNWELINYASLLVPGTATSSRYIIEYIGEFDLSGGKQEKIDLSKSLPEPQFPWVFRITAIGYSSNTNIYSVLESTFATESL